MALNDKQIRFCDEYLVSFNATDAAIKAGYSKKTAAVIGAENLIKPNIQEYLEKKKQKFANKLEITREMVMEGYRKLAFYDARKFYDEDGNILPVPELDDETAFALTGFEVGEDKIEIKGKQLITGYTKKIKLSDRKTALDSICKVLGYNAPEKVELEIPQLDNLSKEELKQLLALQTKAGA